MYNKCEKCSGCKCSKCTEITVKQLFLVENGQTANTHLHACEECLYKDFNVSMLVNYTRKVQWKASDWQAGGVVRGHGL